MKKLFTIFTLLLISIAYTNAQTPELWGITCVGGINSLGVIFKTDGNGENQSVVLTFDTYMGSKPYGSLIQASNGKLYGMTSMGGANNYGVLFEYDPVTDTYTRKFDFDGSNNGKEPHGSLIQAYNGKLYGMTSRGGVYDYGVLFEYDPATDTYTKKFDFDGYNNGRNPEGSLMQASNGKLYGMTSMGGANVYGVLFEYDPATDICTKKFDFGEYNNGYIPKGSLIQASNGKLYGMTTGGGVNYFGVIFEYDLVTDTYTKKFDFAGISNGKGPHGSLIQASNGKLYGMTLFGGANDYGVLFEYDPVTNTYTKKLDFDGINNGAHPEGSLIQASNGKLYGMTYLGGANNYGVLFEYDPATDIYAKKLNFDFINGALPQYTSLIETNFTYPSIVFQNEAVSVNIYPNPSNGIVNIDLKNLQNVSIKVYDLTGKLILSEQNINERIHNLNLNQPVGFYIIELTANNQTQRYKLIIK